MLPYQISSRILALLTGTGVAASHSNFVRGVSSCPFQKLLMVLLLGITDLQILLLGLPARGGILLLFSPSLKLSPIWDGVGTQGDSEKFFDIQSPYQRPPPRCYGAAEQLWGVFRAHGRACQCHPHSRVQSAVFPCAAAVKGSGLCPTKWSFPGLSSQQGSPQEPLGISWKQWE